MADTRTQAKSAFAATVKRDLTLSLRYRNEIAVPLSFFVIVIALFPLGVSPEPTQLASIASGVLWVAALLASLLSADGLFRGDYDDGSLEQFVRSPQSLYLLVIAKLLVHWLSSGLPLTLLAPLLSVLLYLPQQAVLTLFFTLLLGTITLSLIAGIGAALTVSLRKGGVLLALLVLPLFIPVLIFGTAAVNAAQNGHDYLPHLAILGGLALLALALAPLAVAASLRISLEN